MKIHFYIDSMGAGGAERVASLLVNRWAEHGQQIHLVTLAATDDDHYRLNPNVQRTSIGLVGPVRSPVHGVLLNVKRVARIRRLIQTDHPDVAISFITRMNVLLVLAARHAPVIVSERSNPSVHPVPTIIDFGRRRLYTRAAAVVAQTEAASSWITQNCPGARVVVLPNPVAELPLVPEKDSRLVVAAGRLENTKGFDLLIAAMTMVHNEQPDARLRIYGEGELRANLAHQISSLGLDHVVELVGGYDDAATALGGAAVFVLSSRYEGYPNVLVEALKLGTPVVAFACDHGPAEIIRDGENGLLIDPGNVPALAQVILDLLRSSELRSRLRSAAAESVGGLRVEAIGRRWDDLITRARHESGGGDR